MKTFIRLAAIVLLVAASLTSCTKDKSPAPTGTSTPAPTSTPAY